MVMKVLFVCRQNIGRSQMAMELHRLAHPTDEVASAGTIVDVPGQMLQDAPAPKTIAAMQELGVDVSRNSRQQLTPEMLDGYDKIIVMSEPNNTPEWLESHPRAVRWNISDPKEADLVGTEIIRDELQKRTAQL